jgi:23S rRNA (pseudouridine1915-N3)-methyltransferase
LTRLKIVWPGKTKNRDLRALEQFYLARIRQLEACDLIEAKEARGLADRHAEKIMEIEARNIERHLRDEYVICLSDRGREMNSADFARFMERQMSASRGVAFIVGGFAGLGKRILKRADHLLSVSRLTLSHELCRAVLLEQLYRALTIQKGKRYAK